GTTFVLTPIGFLPLPPTNSLRSLFTNAVDQHDPNDKVGPAGFGSAGYMAATAPAPRVTLTDHLDPSLDWSTFRFTEAGFGDNLISIPAGSQHYRTTVS